MSGDPACRHCRFAAAYDQLQCRRRAPFVTGGMMSSIETVWPVVKLGDWCGEFDRGGVVERMVMPHPLTCQTCGKIGSDCACPDDMPF